MTKFYKSKTARNKFTFIQSSIKLMKLMKLKLMKLKLIKLKLMEKIQLQNEVRVEDFKINF